MRGNRSKFILAAVMMAVATLSCNNATLFSDSYALEERNWSIYDPAKFACSVEDTVRAYDIELSLRTSTDYPYRNMYLFIVTSFPSGSTVTDTLHAMVANEKGSWLGKGAGDLRALTIPYKSNVYFPEKGEYHFRVIHGMRDTILKGVYDVGMKVTLRESREK